MKEPIVLVDEVEPFLDDVVYIRDGKVTLAGETERLLTERGRSLGEIFEEVAT